MYKIEDLEIWVKNLPEDSNKTLWNSNRVRKLEEKVAIWKSDNSLFLKEVDRAKNYRAARPKKGSHMFLFEKWVSEVDDRERERETK